MRPTLHFQGQTTPPDTFELNWRRSAAALQAAGVGDGDVVALMMRNSPQAIELMVAARHLGAQWCPVNWHFKTDEVQYILGNSGAKVFIADAALLAGLHGLDTTGVRAWSIRGEHSGTPAWEAARDAAEPLDTPPAPPRGAMFYTSGTTGQPKGIVRLPMTPAQIQAAAAMRLAAYGLAPGARALLSAPWYHSAPNSFALGLAQENATVFIEERFDAERTLQLISEHALTHAYLVPTMFVRMLALPPEVRAKYGLRSMQFVSSTGSPCPPEVKRAMIDWWGPVINECYGASELGYMTLLTSEQALRKPGSAGLPLPGVMLKILDDDGNEQPAGTAGLIYIHQPATPDFSYAGNEQARARMEVRGLKTMGDIGYLDEEGFLFIVDRKADMVISGGVNIYPVETELALQGMPGVADCAVFGIPDDEFGEALAAAVQPAPGAVLTDDEVRNWLRERLAGYKVPKIVTFHADLPREDTGKIFKRKLREPYWAGRARRV
ncbi:AMP-binding protein [Ramlibacter sp.]|uniref:AMP-binding protein n=1 Tax=Ramlibacter sp. TaxID=1917967 RepID=UPI0035AD829A